MKPRIEVTAKDAKRADDLVKGMLSKEDFEYDENPPVSPNIAFVFSNDDLCRKVLQDLKNKKIEILNTNIFESKNLDLDDLAAYFKYCSSKNLKIAYSHFVREFKDGDEKLMGKSTDEMRAFLTNEIKTLSSSQLKELKQDLGDSLDESIKQKLHRNKYFVGTKKLKHVKLFEEQLNEEWTGKLQDQYDDFDDFLSHDEVYGLAKRLGFKSAQEAWDENPTITGTTDPNDYKVVESKLYSFVTNKKSLTDFLKQSQDGLSPNVHSGFLLAKKNTTGGFDMLFQKALPKKMDGIKAYVKYPNNDKEPIIYIKEGEDSKLEAIISFLSTFPDNATSWKDATDEIRDLSKESREILKDIDNVEVEPFDFRKAGITPAEWNKGGKKSILDNYAKMSDDAKQNFFEANKELFGELEESTKLHRNKYFIGTKKLKHVKLYEGFSINESKDEETLIKELESELKNKNLSYKVDITDDPTVEDSSVYLEDGFHFQISSGVSPYILWHQSGNSFKELGSFVLPKVAVNMYILERKRIKK